MRWLLSKKVSRSVPSSRNRRCISLALLSRLILFVFLFQTVEVVLAQTGGNYVSDLDAFFKEADVTYPFFELKGIRQDWADTKPRLKEKVNACATDTEFLGIVLEAIRCLRDSHMGLRSQIPLPQPEKKYFPGISFLPATKDRVIVMVAAEAYASKLKPGTVVTQIDGQDARKFLDNCAKAEWSCDNPHYASSPQRARLFVCRIPLAGAQGAKHTLKYLQNGEELELEVSCNLEARGWPHYYNLPGNGKALNASVTHALLPSGVGYLYLRHVRPETVEGIQKALEASPSAKGWIIDLRGNGGGGYDSTLIELLKNLPRPVVALIDAGCISAGETLARDLATFAQARLMGSKTAGASSSKRQWTFPSGIATVTFSTRSRWRDDGQPIELNGISPDVEVEAIPEEVAQGQNSEICRAEEYIAKHATQPGAAGPKETAVRKPPPSGATITGSVVDENGTPLPGVRISAIGWDGAAENPGETVSSPGGEYLLAHIKPGVEYRVFANAAGRAAAYWSKTTARGVTNVCDFRLPKGLRLSGQVRDTSGRPVTNVCLELIPTRWDPPAAQSFLPLGGCEVTTDGSGKFLCPAAAAGRYWAKVYQPSPRGDRRWQQVAQPAPLLLKRGEPVDNLQLRIEPPESCTISGVVTDSKGRGLAGGDVGTSIPRDRTWWTLTDGEGRFVLKSLNGLGKHPLDLKAFNDQVTLRNVFVGSQNLTIAAPVQTEVKGLVVDERDQAVEQYELRVNRVHLPGSEAIVFQPGAKVRKGVRPGEFHLTGLPAGRAVLELQVGQRVQWSSIQVLPGGAAPSQRIRLQPPAVFAGSALFISGSGQTQNAGLEVLHLDTGREMGWINSEPSGAFRSEALPAGEYMVRAVYGGERYSTKKVRLEAGRTTLEEFRVGGTASIVGTIEFPEEIFSEVGIWLRKPGLPSPVMWDLGRPRIEEQAIVWVTVGKSGSEYRIPYVLAGKWELLAIAGCTDRSVPVSMRPHRVETIEIAEGQTKTLDLRLKMPGNGT